MYERTWLPRIAWGLAWLFAGGAIHSAPSEDLPVRRPLDAPRIEPIELEKATERQKRLVGDTNINVTKTIVQHEDLAEAWLTFARYVLAENSLPARDREILILRIGWLCQSEYEWGQHARIARQVGMTDTEIERITKGPDAAGWTAHERALLRATDELRESAFVSDATWAELAKTYSKKQLMDVVFTVGEYNLVSMALRTFGVQPEEGLGGFPE